MLKLFKLNLKTANPVLLKNKGDYIGPTRHYPPANQEWFNSIYAYNKNTAKSLPVADNFILKLIKSYFSMYSKRLEKKIKAPWLRLRLRRLSTNRILVSKAELKHTSDKVIVNVYTYNRQNTYYYNKIKNLAVLGALNFKSFNIKLDLIKNKVTQIISTVKREKNLLLKPLRWEDNNFNSYEANYSKIFIMKALKKEMLFLYFKQIMFFNKAKFRNTYLVPLKILIQKIYNKKVEFNFISLKYYHLNNDIFLQIVAIKLRNRKNRILRVLKTSLRKIKLPALNKSGILDDLYINKPVKIQNYILKDLISRASVINKEQAIKDKLDVILNKHYNLSTTDSFIYNDENTVLESIKHKNFNGIRVEASGRLSKRITAARSVFKFKYIGNLKNIDSSYKGLSSVVLRGTLKSNIQHTKLNSKTRIGSYGLKSWINSV
jgi:Mitochondrial ribosomal protein (VAR1)